MKKVNIELVNLSINDVISKHSERTSANSILNNDIDFLSKNQRLTENMSKEINKLIFKRFKEIVSQILSTENLNLDDKTMKKLDSFQNRSKTVFNEKNFSFIKNIIDENNLEIDTSFSLKDMDNFSTTEIKFKAILNDIQVIDRKFKYDEESLSFDFKKLNLLKSEIKDIVDFDEQEKSLKKKKRNINKTKSEMYKSIYLIEIIKDEFGGEFDLNDLTLLGKDSESIDKIFGKIKEFNKDREAQDLPFVKIEKNEISKSLNFIKTYDFFKESRNLSGNLNNSDFEDLSTIGIDDIVVKNLKASSVLHSKYRMGKDLNFKKLNREFEAISNSLKNDLSTNNFYNIKDDLINEHSTHIQKFDESFTAYQKGILLSLGLSDLTKDKTDKEVLELYQNLPDILSQREDKTIIDMFEKIKLSDKNTADLTSLEIIIENLDSITESEKFTYFSEIVDVFNNTFDEDVNLIEDVLFDSSILESYNVSLKIYEESHKQYDSNSLIDIVYMNNKIKTNTSFVNDSVEEIKDVKDLNSHFTNSAELLESIFKYDKYIEDDIIDLEISSLKSQIIDDMNNDVDTINNLIVYKNILDVYRYKNNKSSDRVESIGNFKVLLNDFLYKYIEKNGFLDNLNDGNDNNDNEIYDKLIEDYPKFEELNIIDDIEFKDMHGNVETYNLFQESIYDIQTSDYQQKNISKFKKLINSSETFKEMLGDDSLNLNDDQIFVVQDIISKFNESNIHNIESNFDDIQNILHLEKNDDLLIMFNEKISQKYDNNEIPFSLRQKINIFNKEMKNENSNIHDLTNLLFNDICDDIEFKSEFESKVRDNIIEDPDNIEKTHNMIFELLIDNGVVFSEDSEKNNTIFNDLIDNLNSVAYVNNIANNRDNKNLLLLINDEKNTRKFKGSMKELFGSEVEFDNLTNHQIYDILNITNKSLLEKLNIYSPDMFDAKINNESFNFDYFRKFKNNIIKSETDNTTGDNVKKIKSLLDAEMNTSLKTKSSLYNLSVSGMQFDSFEDEIKNMYLMLSTKMDEPYFEFLEEADRKDLEIFKKMLKSEYGVDESTFKEANINNDEDFYYLYINNKSLDENILSSKLKDLENLNLLEKYELFLEKGKSRISEDDVANIEEALNFIKMSNINHKPEDFETIFKYKLNDSNKNLLEQFNGKSQGYKDTLSKINDVKKHLFNPHIAIGLNDTTNISTSFDDIKNSEFYQRLIDCEEEFNTIDIFDSDETDKYKGLIFDLNVIKYNAQTVYMKETLESIKDSYLSEDMQRNFVKNYLNQFYDENSSFVENEVKAQEIFEEMKADVEVLLSNGESFMKELDVHSSKEKVLDSLKTSEGKENFITQNKNFIHGTLKGEFMDRFKKASTDEEKEVIYADALEDLYNTKVLDLETEVQKFHMNPKANYYDKVPYRKHQVAKINDIVQTFNLINKNSKSLFTAPNMLNKLHMKRDNVVNELSINNSLKSLKELTMNKDDETFSKLSLTRFDNLYKHGKLTDDNYSKYLAYFGKELNSDKEVVDTPNFTGHEEGLSELRNHLTNVYKIEDTLSKEQILVEFMIDHMNGELSSLEFMENVNANFDKTDTLRMLTIFMKDGLITEVDFQDLLTVFKLNDFTEDNNIDEEEQMLEDMTTSIDPETGNEVVDEDKLNVIRSVQGFNHGDKVKWGSASNLLFDIPFEDLLSEINTSLETKHADIYKDLKNKSIKSFDDFVNKNRGLDFLAMLKVGQVDFDIITGDYGVTFEKIIKDILVDIVMKDYPNHNFTDDEAYNMIFNTGATNKFFGTQMYKTINVLKDGLNEEFFKEHALENMSQLREDIGDLSVGKGDSLNEFRDLVKEQKAKESEILALQKILNEEIANKTLLDSNSEDADDEYKQMQNTANEKVNALQEQMSKLDGDLGSINAKIEDNKSQDESNTNDLISKRKLLSKINTSVDEKEILGKKTLAQRLYFNSTETNVPNDEILNNSPSEMREQYLKDMNNLPFSFEEKRKMMESEANKLKRSESLNENIAKMTKNLKEKMPFQSPEYQLKQNMELLGYSDSFFSSSTRSVFREVKYAGYGAMKILGNPIMMGLKDVAKISLSNSMPMDYQSGKKFLSNQFNVSLDTELDKSTVSNTYNYIIEKAQAKDLREARKKKIEEAPKMMEKNFERILEKIKYSKNPNKELADLIENNNIFKNILNPDKKGKFKEMNLNESVIDGFRTKIFDMFRDNLKYNIHSKDQKRCLFALFDILEPKPDTIRAILNDNYTDWSKKAHINSEKSKFYSDLIGTLKGDTYDKKGQLVKNDSQDSSYLTFKKYLREYIGESVDKENAKVQDNLNENLTNIIEKFNSIKKTINENRLDIIGEDKNNTLTELFKSTHDAINDTIKNNDSDKNFDKDLDTSKEIYKHLNDFASKSKDIMIDKIKELTIKSSSNEDFSQHIKEFNQALVEIEELIVYLQSYRNQMSNFENSYLEYQEILDEMKNGRALNNQIDTLIEEKNEKYEEIKEKEKTLVTLKDEFIKPLLSDESLGEEEKSALESYMEELDSLIEDESSDIDVVLFKIKDIETIASNVGLEENSKIKEFISSAEALNTEIEDIYDEIREKDNEINDLSDKLHMGISLDKYENIEIDNNEKMYFDSSFMVDKYPALTKEHSLEEIERLYSKYIEEKAKKEEKAEKIIEIKHGGFKYLEIDNMNEKNMINYLEVLMEDIKSFYTTSTNINDKYLFGQQDKEKQLEIFEEQFVNLLESGKVNMGGFTKPFKSFIKNIKENDSHVLKESTNDFKKDVKSLRKDFKKQPDLENLTFKEFLKNIDDEILKDVKIGKNVIDSELSDKEIMEKKVMDEIALSTNKGILNAKKYVNGVIRGSDNLFKVIKSVNPSETMENIKKSSNVSEIFKDMTFSSSPLHIQIDKELLKGQTEEEEIVHVTQEEISKLNFNASKKDKKTKNTMS